MPRPNFKFPKIAFKSRCTILKITEVTQVARKRNLALMDPSARMNNNQPGLRAGARSAGVVKKFHLSGHGSSQWIKLP